MNYLNLLCVMLSSQDLFADAWTEGNLNSINWLTSNLGSFAGMIISAVGFCIVIFSILKNAISGLYVVNPNLWDKVDELKKASAGEWNHGNVSGGWIQNASGSANLGNDKANAAFAKIGGAAGFLIALLPNVRELTDFQEGEDIDKKQYFTKSIIAMIFQIFIGVLIFFGYPTQFASWVGSFGTAAIDMVITNVDPIATLNMVADKTSNLQWIYAEAEKPSYHYYVREGAQSAYTSVVGVNNDMQAGPRQLLANELENWLAESCMSYMETIGASDGYQTSVASAYVTQAPVIPDGATPISVINGGGYSTTSKSGTVTIKVWRSVGSFNTGSTEVGQTDYVAVTYTCSKTALKVTSTVYANAHFTTGAAVMTGSKQLKIELNGIPYAQGGSIGSIDGLPGTCDVTYYTSPTEALTVAGRLDVQGNKLVLILDGSQRDAAAAISKTKVPAVITFGFTGNFKYIAGGANAQQDIKIQQFMLNSKYDESGNVTSGSGEGLTLSIDDYSVAPSKDANEIYQKVSSSGATKTE